MYEVIKYVGAFLCDTAELAVLRGILCYGHRGKNISTDPTQRNNLVTHMGAVNGHLALWLSKRITQDAKHIVHHAQ